MHERWIDTLVLLGIAEGQGAWVVRARDRDQPTLGEQLQCPLTREQLSAIYGATKQYFAN